MKNKKILKLFLVITLLSILATGCRKEEKYKPVGQHTEPEYLGDNAEIPGDGFANKDDLQEPTGTVQNPVDTTNPGGDEPVDVNPGRSFIVALDAGHGGAYSGAQYDGRTEKYETWKVTTKIKAYLEENYPNVQVVLVHGEDEVLSSDLAEDLRLRVKAAADANADALLSIHFNASEKHDSNGAMICISKQPNIHEDSERLAKSILSRLESLGLKNNGPYNRSSNDTVDDNGVPVDYYAINRHGAKYDVVAIIVENCYMDSSIDIPFMESDEALDALAKADAEGLMAYLNSLPEE